MTTNKHSAIEACEICGGVMEIHGGTDDVAGPDSDGQTWYYWCPVCDGEDGRRDGEAEP